MRPNWLNALYGLAALAVAVFFVVASVVVWSAGGTLRNADKLITTATGTAEETRLAASRFNEPERVARIDEYIIRQSAAALATTNNSRKIANNLNEVIKGDLRPMLQDLRPRLNATIDTLNAQIAANGDRAQALLLEGENTIKEARILIANNQEDFTAAVKSLKQAGYNAEVLSDPQHLGKAALELANTLEHTSAVTGSAQSIGEDLAKLSAAKIRPLYEPQKRGFFGKALNVFNTAIKFTRGASTIIVLAGQF